MSTRLHNVYRALALTLGLSAVYSIAGWFLAPRLDFDKEHSRPDMVNFMSGPEEPPSQTPGYAFAGIWKKWDAHWWLEVAQHGYRLKVDVNYYPLFALLIRGVAMLGVPPLIAALFLARLATFLFLWGLFELLSLDLDQASVWRGVILTLVWPSTYIFFAPYAESTVAAFAVWGLLWARRGHWWAAAACCFTGALAKHIVFALWVAMAWLARKEWKLRWKPLVFALSGFAVYPLFLKLGGLPSIPEAFRTFWGADPYMNLAYLQRLADALFVQRDGAVLLHASSFAICLYLLLRQVIRPEYTAYGLTCLLVFFFKVQDPPLCATSRYVTVVWPAWVGAGLRMKRLPFFVAMATALFMANLRLLYLFWSWRPVV